MPLPGRPKDFHRPATRITDLWFRARDGRRLERTPQAPSARQDRTIGLAQRQGQITGYLLLATACDGTLATTAQFTSARIVCRNTLQIALGDSTSVVKVLFDSKAILKSPALPSRRRYLKIHPATICETTRFFAERGVADGNVIWRHVHPVIQEGIFRSRASSDYNIPRRCPHMPSNSRGLCSIAQECKNPRSLKLSRVFGTTRTTWDVYLVPGTGLEPASQ